MKQRRLQMTKPTIISAPRVGTERAFTLLEMLLVLALIVVLLGGLASLIRVFSNSYLADERRVSGAQLARSISQMLSDDLVAAVQDPIQSVSEDPSRQYIRHFGLRGDARSLQIDVVRSYTSLFRLTPFRSRKKKSRRRRRPVQARARISARLFPVRSRRLLRA